MYGQRLITIIHRSASVLAVLAGTTVLSSGAALAVALPETCPPAEVQELEMCDLGSLRTDNLGLSRANAVSADGSVIVGSAATDSIVMRALIKVDEGPGMPVAGMQRAFRWANNGTGMQDLGSLRMDNQGGSIAHAVSANGIVVVGEAETDDMDGRAFRWVAGNAGMQDLGSLVGPAQGSSVALALSADGSVVVGKALTADKTGRAFIWTDDGKGMLDLGTLAGGALAESTAVSVSADGTVVAGFSDTADGSVRAFRWFQGSEGMEDLGSLRPMFGNSTAAAVSADGSVIIGQAQTSDGATRAFRWMGDGAGMLDLGSLTGAAKMVGNSYATAVSADGVVIVGNSDTVDGVERAFRWTGDVGMLDLGSLRDGNTGWSDAAAVSADGAVIVGRAQTEDGAHRAFRWRDDGTGMMDLGTLRPDNLGTSFATAVSADGEVIVGAAATQDGSTRAFIWRNGAMVDHVNTAQSATDSAQTLAAAASEFTQGTLGQLGVEIDVLEPAAAADDNVTVSTQGRLAAQGPRMAMRLGGSLLHNSGIASRAGADVAMAVDMGQGYTLGAFLDIARETDSKSAVSLSGMQVSGGAWLRFRENRDQTGLTWRVSAGAGTGRFDVTREAILPGTIAGSGRTTVTTTGLSAELGYGVPMANGVAVPFARLSAARTSRSAYTEDAAAVFPLSYDAHRDSAVVATLGVDTRLAVAERTALTAGLGISHDLHRSSNPVTGTSAIPGLPTFSVPGPAVVNRTRGYASFGVIQAVGNGAAIRATATVAQSPWTKSATLSARVGYEMRF